MSAEMTLPDSWIITQLGKYIYLKNGYAFKSNSYVDEKGSNTVPIIRISDIDGKYATDLKAMHVSSSAAAFGFEVEKGDLLIAMSGATTGKVGVYNGNIPAYQNQRVGNLKFINETYKSESFRNHLIAYLSPEILKIAYGGAQPNISGKAIEEMNVVIPPIAEQHKIAQRLDELLAQVDTIKARLDAIPAILKRFRQSVLSAAVSGKLTEEWRGNRTFDHFCTLGSITIDIRYGTSKKCDSETGNTPVLRIPNISNGYVDLSDLKFADFEKNETEKLKLKKGDILVIRSNGSVELVGKPALIDEKTTHCLFAGYLIRLRFKQDFVVPKYILYCIQSPETRKIIELQARSTSGVNNINSKELADLVFAIPEIAEQTEIVRRVDQFFAFADQIEQRINDAKARVDKLTQSILAKAFRGELTADWRAEYPELISGENSAEALLAKIQAAKAALEGKKKKGKAA